MYHRRVIARTVGAFAAAVAGLAFVEGAARANDSEALLAGGVLTFKKSDGISMESEDLSIKPNEVQVAYKFRNTTSADITTLVAFPLAPYELSEEDDQGDPDKPADPNGWPWKNLGDFSVRADGRPVHFEATVKWGKKAVVVHQAVGAPTTFDQKIVTVTYHWMQTFPAERWCRSSIHSDQPVATSSHSQGVPSERPPTDET